MITITYGLRVLIIFLLLDKQKIDFSYNRINQMTAMSGLMFLFETIYNISSHILTCNSVWGFFLMIWSSPYIYEVSFKWHFMFGSFLLLKELRNNSFDLSTPKEFLRFIILLLLDFPVGKKSKQKLVIKDDGPNSLFSYILRI